jgi:ppGpp synthetase/RelA/SpoT-type nucleotidyltranferase
VLNPCQEPSTESKERAKNRSWPGLQALERVEVKGEAWVRLRLKEIELFLAKLSRKGIELTQET